MDAFSAGHASAAAIAKAKAAAEQAAATAATAATLAAAWPSPSAAAFASMAASHAAAMSATAARVVASSEATIPSMPRCQARSEAAAAAAAERAALVEIRPELASYFMSLDSEADSMPLSPSESNNLDDPAWGDFLDGCEFEVLEDDYTVTSEDCGPSDSDLEYFGFCRKNLNDPHCNMETSQIVSRLSEISMEDRPNQDSEQLLTGCSLGASTYCFK